MWAKYHGWALTGEWAALEGIQYQLNFGRSVWPERLKIGAKLENTFTNLIWDLI